MSKQENDILKISIGIAIGALILTLVVCYFAFSKGDSLGSAYSRSWNVWTGATANSHLSVHATSTKGGIVNANGNRKHLVISNIGTSTVYVWFNTSTDLVVVNKGIALYPYATGTTTSTDKIVIDSDNLYRGPIQAITASGESSLLSIFDY